MLDSNKIVLQYLSLYLVFVVSFLLINNNSYFYNAPSAYISKQDETVVKENPPKISYQPNYVRGIYLTAYSAGSDDFRENIMQSMADSKINTVVIDIKDYSGYILYNSQLPELKNIDAIRARMSDVRQIISDFHNIGVYVIARQTVFQDPVLATARPELAVKTKNGNTWYDNKGLAWMDPAQREVWDYNLAIAKEAASLGFDEINFDYMRYPSDGNMGNIYYDLPPDTTKAEMLDTFFKFLSDNLSNRVKISIDTFGLVLDHTDDNYDLGIGQILDSIADHFDYVSPMMYPSHYPLTYLGFANSAEHPGAVISYGLEISSSTMRGKRAQLRPWLQAFNLRAIYDQSMIEAQERAVENTSSTNGWLLWNARNYYPNYIF